jgi:hypothetical protein
MDAFASPFTFRRLGGIRNKSFRRSEPLLFAHHIHHHTNLELSRDAVVKHCLAGPWYRSRRGRQVGLQRWLSIKCRSAQERGNPGSTIYRYSTRVTPFLDVHLNVRGRAVHNNVVVKNLMKIFFRLKNPCKWGNALVSAFSHQKVLLAPSEARSL